MFIVGGSIYISLLTTLTITNADFGKQKDAYEYAIIGSNLWNGNGIEYLYGPDVILSPGFPVMIGMINFVVGRLEWCGKIVTFMSACFSFYLFFLISNFFFNDKRWATISLFLYLSNSNIILNATNGYSESFFILIFLSLMYLVLIAQSFNTVKLIILFSALWAVLYLTRPEGLIIGGVLFAGLFRKQKNIRFLTIPVATCICIFPYLVFLHEHTNVWQLSGRTYSSLVMGELSSPYQREEDLRHNERYDVINQTLKMPAKSAGFFNYFDESGHLLMERLPMNFKKILQIYWFTFSFFGVGLIVVGLIGATNESKIILISLYCVVFLYLLFFILHRLVSIYHWVLIIFLANGLRVIDAKFEIVRKYKFSVVICIAICLYEIRSAVKILL